MKLADLVPLKEGSMQARELAKDYSMSQLQRMLDQRLGPDQEAASNMPNFDPNEFSDSEDFGPSANDLDAAITILQRQAAKEKGIPKDLTYGQAIGQDPLPDGTYLDKYGNKTTVARSKDEFTRSSKFDRMNEITLKKGDVIKFENGGRIHIIGPKGDGYDYQDGNEKGHHPKKWFDMMISTGKAMVVKEGTCGYGPNGVPGKTPGGTRGMSGDDRTRTMLKMLIKKEIAKLS